MGVLPMNLSEINRVLSGCVEVSWVGLILFEIKEDRNV